MLGSQKSACGGLLVRLFLYSLGIQQDFSSQDQADWEVEEAGVRLSGSLAQVPSSL